MFCIHGSDDFQFVGIFQVYHLVTDVVGGFDQIDQRVTGIAHRILGLFPQTEVGRNFVKKLSLCLEEAEFGFFAGQD